MVGSFYDPELDEGCAFEELISFHGGIGGPQTRPFILYPARLPLPAADRSASEIPVIVSQSSSNQPFRSSRVDPRRLRSRGSRG